MINGLDNVYYLVSNVKNSVEFYTTVLGLSILDQDDHWASISLNGTRLGLHKANSNEFSKTSEKRAGATVTLSVTDIDQAYAHFKSKGVKFLGPISKNPWGSHVSFCDPDGNLLDLRQAPIFK
jgi:predicted enzyme related to lactoylglutathione lyase